MKQRDKLKLFVLNNYRKTNDKIYLAGQENLGKIVPKSVTSKPYTQNIPKAPPK